MRPHATTRSLVLSGLALALLATAAPGQEQPAPDKPTIGSLLDRIGFDQKLDAQVPLDLTFRDEEGRATAMLHDPTSGASVALWVDPSYRWLMVYTGDDNPEGTRRRSVAVEPMTAQANAFVTGEDLLVLQPDGVLSGSWGIRTAG